MQELRLVAVSEDGTYLVLATAGRGTRFTLPVDDRLRAAVRGHFSRLGQFEIEVESPLRPKEIQARIRSGETAEEIAESAGIPVERVRWFEGPVLQEREYMAQQAQRVAVRRPGESSPGPPLGETVEERLGRGGVDLEEVEWDSWKCEDNTWRVRLSFFDNGRPHAAEWTFDPRRRHVSPLDEIAARLTAVDWDDEPLSDTVTPLVPRRPAMKVVSSDRDPAPRGLPPAEPERPAAAPEPLRAAAPRDYAAEQGRVTEPRTPFQRPGEAAALREAVHPVEPVEAEPVETVAPAPAVSEPVETALGRDTSRAPEIVEPVEEARAPGAAPPAEADERREAVTEPDATPASEPVRPLEDESPREIARQDAEDAPDDAVESRESDEDDDHEPARAETVEDERDDASAAEQEIVRDEPAEEASDAAPPPKTEPAPKPAPPKPAPPKSAAPEPADDEQPARDEKPAAAQRPAQRQSPRTPPKKKPAARPTMPAAAQDKPATGSPAAAANGEPQGAPRPARRRKAKGKRASVPSWDEIMFGARRPE
ncbi:septation protein SepH [Spirillospora sp. NBC_00431]